MPHAINHFCHGFSGYILTFPQELQLGADEKFCLSLFNVSTDVSLTLNISCYGKHETFSPGVFISGEYEWTAQIDQLIDMKEGHGLLVVWVSEPLPAKKKKKNNNNKNRF